ncbi:universal stress protein PHOS32-like isoform X2 [Hibiscus syriacus]|uniref:universal stress protein PHOS32-like isoform X2 n=1 Tax=Hibiscus syriacus TaxID=106335 RepID=UPI00192191F8|nr:universal stress protein PHOS32-like isoform X2 [Hibiscus syriacus]XP_039025737.1 universal stress protein PHOS32-like isoform X2 [Hibiscus syriacus]XP_039025738.1 universal stress protein PHOS32-like isoform X2 [Hibiscus syriacus]
MNPSDYGDHPQLPTIKIHHPSSPHHPTSTATPTAGARRRIGVAVDLSEESAFAVRWAVQDYIRAEDAVLLLHVSPTSVLYGADWGPLPHTPQSPGTPQSQKQLEDDFDAFTASKVADLAKPLKEAGIPFKIHIVKDHDMRERLCLEVERLGLSAVIMGSRGFGAEKRGSDGKLGSVSDYCVHHCVCPVVVVRCPEDKEGGNGKPVVTVKEAEVEAESGKDA